MNYSVQEMLELSCAAQRYNNDYCKSNEVVYSDDGKVMGYKYSNKMLMLFTLDPSRRNESNLEYLPPVLTVTEDDKAKVEDIRNYYRRLMFSVMAQPENEFLQEIHNLLNKEIMSENKIGFIACLPSTYARDTQRNDVNKILKKCMNSYVGEPNAKLTNLSATVIDCTRSKNFDAYNVLAMVDDKLISWFSRIPIKLGELTIVSAKVKGNNEHWLSKKAETRLNYVKVEK